MWKYQDIPERHEIVARFSCIWCAKRFKTIQGIRDHTRAVHYFNCNDCVKTIRTWTEYLKHFEVCPNADYDTLSLMMEDTKIDK